MKLFNKFIVAAVLFLCAVPALAQQFGTGWVPDKQETERFVKTIPAVYGDDVQKLITKDENADVLLYRGLVPCLEERGQTDWIKVRGNWKVVRAFNQGAVGSCVGNATAAAISVLNAFEVWYLKEMQIFVAMHSADGMYGLGREAANMLRPGDGCTGSGAAKAITQYGTLYCIKYDTADLTNNDPNRARQYGTKGVGESLRKEAAKRKVVSVYRASSAAEAWALIGNGYPINVCSGQGFSKQRDNEGICRPSGSWNHSMAIIARRTTSDGRKLFLIWNSWGDDWAGGSYWQDMPFGSFWAEYGVVDGMLRQGDSFAYSDLDGFPVRSIPDYGSKHFLGKITIQPDEESHATSSNGDRDRGLGVGSGNGNPASTAGTGSRDSVSATSSGTGGRSWNGESGTVRFQAP